MSTRRVAVVLVSAVLALALGEAALQVAYRVRKHRWLWDGDAFRVRYVQAVGDRRQYALAPGYRDGTITVDANGFRVVEPATTEGREVIACLGDSVPFGAGVRDAETYPQQLAELLAKSPEPIAVVNAGIPSYNLRQSMDRLRLDVEARWKPPAGNRTVAQAICRTIRERGLLAR